MTDTRSYFFNNLVSQFGLTPNQALGVLYSLGGESGSSLNPNAYRKDDAGPGKPAVGVAQWNSGRLDALNSVASSLGTTVNDPRAQWAHMQGELTGPYAKVITDIKKAGDDTNAAGNIWTKEYESPAVNNWNDRWAKGKNVGSVDAQGNFVPGSQPPSSGGFTLNGPQAIPPSAPNSASPGTAPASGPLGGLSALLSGTAGQGLGSLAQGLSGSNQQPAPAPPPPPHMQTNAAGIASQAPGLMQQVLKGNQRASVVPSTTPNANAQGISLSGMKGVGMGGINPYTGQPYPYPYGALGSGGGGGGGGIGFSDGYYM